MIFWFGLTGLIFLAWTWEWSAQKYTELRFPTENFRFLVGDGLVEFTRFQPTPGDRFDPSFDTWWTKRGLERGHFDFPKGFLDTYDFEPAYWTWEIAIWLIIAIYVPVWLAIFGAVRLFRRLRSVSLPDGSATGES